MKAKILISKEIIIYVFKLNSKDLLIREDKYNKKALK